MNHKVTWLHLYLWMWLMPLYGTAQNLVVTGRDTLFNATYDNVTVQSGGVLMVDGVLNVRQNMIIESGGTVTHRAHAVAGLTLNVTSRLEIKPGAILTADRLGLLGGFLGNFGVHGETFNGKDSIISAENGATSRHNNGGDYNGAGGSHGGTGGFGVNTLNQFDFKISPNKPYGTPLFPNHLGAGGGGSLGGGLSRQGGNGGGLLILNAQTLRNDGIISCNGGVIPGGGGGAGGSVRITTDTLLGNGMITANGGNGTISYYSPGAGGGGRIALFFKQNYFPLQNVAAIGGVGRDQPNINTNFIGSYSNSGAAGTIFLKNQLESKGDLRVDNRNIFAPVNTTIEDETAIYRTVQILNQGRAAISKRFAFDTLFLTNNALMVIPKDSIASLDKLDISNLIVQNGGIHIEPNAILELASAKLVLPTSLSFVKDGKLGRNDSLNVVQLQNGAVLTHSHRLRTGLTLRVRDSLILEQGSHINVSERGLSGFMTGGHRAVSLDSAGNIGNIICNNCATGGSYASWGGSGDGIPTTGAERIYGLVEAPTALGSGGGGITGSSPSGGHGGGKVLIESNQIVLNGNIAANGGAGGDEGNNGRAKSGGGSGGSVWIKCRHLQGAGFIAANGGGGVSGSSVSGSGSGGRIAIEFETLNLPETNIQASSGTHTNISPSAPLFFAGAGTIFLKNTASNQPKVWVDNRSITKSAYLTPLRTRLNTFSEIKVSRNGQLALPETSRIKVQTLSLDSSSIFHIPAHTILQLPSTDFTVTGRVIKDGSIGIADTFGKVSIRNGGILTHSIGLQKGLRIKAAAIEVQTGGKIQVTGVGLRGGLNGSRFNTVGEAYGLDGKTVVSGSSNGVGGSYGGLGGQGNNASSPNVIYGDAYYPILLGSGGGAIAAFAAEPAGNGGGLAHLWTKHLIANGDILANGMTTAIPSHAGGGSGGSILIFADTISGNGQIHAKGGNGGCGNCSGGSGGGGRIAIYAPVANFSAARLNVDPGISNGDSPQRGTIVYQNCGFAKNVGVDTILYPYNAIAKLDSFITPMAVFKNYTPTLTAFPVSFQIGNSYRESAQLVLQAGQSDTIRFPAWQVRETGTLNVTVSTNLAGDNCTFNNQKTSVLTVSQAGIPAITTIAPNRGGNTGVVTVQLTGIHFRNGIQVWLERDGQQITAHYVQWVDSNQVFASFNLVGAALGTYHIFAQNTDIQRGQLNNAFEVVQGTIGWGGTTSVNCMEGSFEIGELLTIETSYPTAVRLNTIYPIIIRFKNTSNIDIPVPTRTFESVSGFLNEPPNRISFDESALQLACISNCMTRLTLFLREKGGPANILRAGAGGEIKVYMRAVYRGKGKFRIIE